MNGSEVVGVGFINVLLLAVPQLVVSSDIDVCALETSIPEACARLIPGLEELTGPGGDLEHLLITVERSAVGHAWVQVLDGDALLLERQIPIDTEACVVVADSVALILECYLQDIGWRGGPTLPSREAATARRTPVSVDDAEPEAEPSNGWWEQLHVGVSQGAYLSPQEPLQLSLGGGLWLAWSSFELELGAYGSLPHSQPVQVGGVTRGELRVASLDLLARTSLCLDARGRLCADLWGGAERFAGVVEGDELYHKRDATLWLTTLAAGAHYSFNAFEVLQPLVALALMWRPTAASFDIEGSSQGAGVNALGVMLFAGVQVRFF